MNDIRQVLRSLSIEYVEGAKSSRGHVNIRCPLCPDDHGNHLGIRLQDGRYYCWRDHEHRGPDCAYPLSLLTGLPVRAIREMLDLGGGEAVSTSELRRRLRTKAELEQGPPAVCYPSHFRDKIDQSSIFYQYLRDRRGIPNPVEAFRLWNLRGATIGPYRNRLIFPVYGPGQRMIGWYGRALHDSPVRYKASSPLVTSGLTCAPSFFEGGRLAVLVEGQVDALKLDMAGEFRGVRVAALMSSSLKQNQKPLIAQAVRRFRALAVVCDPKAFHQARAIAAELAPLGARAFQSPAEAEDIGALDFQACASFSLWLAKKCRVG